MRRLFSFRSVSILSLAFLAAAYADTLRLRDGRVVNGQFVSATRYSVNFRNEQGRMERFNVGNIDSLWFGNSYGNSSNNQQGAYNHNGAYTQNSPNNPNNNPNNNYEQAGRYRAGRNAEGQNGYYDQNGQFHVSEDGRVPNAGNTDRYRNTPAQDSRAGELIPAGTVIVVRTIDAIDSDANQVGQTFHASLAQPLVVNGRTIAPQGADATVKIVRLQQGGKITGNEEVALALSSIVANGRTINVTTSDDVMKSSGNRGRQSAEVIGGGAALGAIIGAIAGGGKGAAIGAGVGAAAGAGTEVLRGQHVKVAPETSLSFTLAQDVRMY